MLVRAVNVCIYTQKVQDARTNGQLPKSQLSKKSTSQKHQPEPFGHFMFELTFWKIDSMVSIFSEVDLLS